MTTLMNYVRGEYRADMFRLADPDPSPTRGYRSVRICDCVSREGFLAMSQRAGVTDTRWLPILLFLECALQAGVHSYQRENFDNYVQKLGMAVLIYTHGAMHSVVHRPQAMLRCVHHTPQALKDIEDACVTLLPEWAQAYDAMVTEGAGKRVLEALLGDGDFCGEYWIGEDRQAAQLRGFRTAVGLLSGARV